VAAKAAAEKEKKKQQGETAAAKKAAPSKARTEFVEDFGCVVQLDTEDAWYEASSSLGSPNDSFGTPYSSRGNSVSGPPSTAEAVQALRRNENTVAVLTMAAALANSSLRQNASSPTSAMVPPSALAASSAGTGATNTGDPPTGDVSSPLGAGAEGAAAVPHASIAPEQDPPAIEGGAPEVRRRSSKYVDVVFAAPRHADAPAEAVSSASSSLDADDLHSETMSTIGPEEPESPKSPPDIRGRKV
jgi:hypothetical protein